MYLEYRDSKELTEALNLTNKLLTGLKKNEKKLKLMEKALEGAIEILISIRYQEWPIKGLGVGLQAETLDEVIMLADRVLPKKKKKPK